MTDCHDPFAPLGAYDVDEEGRMVVIPEADVEADNPPAGTVAEVLDWVADDRARARLALQAEGERSAPRSTLVTALEAIVEGRPTAGPAGEAASGPGEALLGVPGPDGAGEGNEGLSEPHSGRADA